MVLVFCVVLSIDYCFAIISVGKRESRLFHCYCPFMAYGCLYSVSLPHGAAGWSLVFDCGFAH